MKYSVLLFFIFLNLWQTSIAGSSHLCTPDAVLRKLAQANIPARKQTNTDEIEKLITSLECFQNKTCKSDLIYLSKGLKKLSETPEGFKLAKKIIDYFQGNQYKHLPHNFTTYFIDCFKSNLIKNRCSFEELEAFMAILDKKWGHEISDHYIERMIRDIDSIHFTPERQQRALYMLNEHAHSKKSGTILGKEEDVKNINGTFYYNGQKMAPDQSYKMKSLIRENKAVLALAKLGFNIKRVSLSSRIRKELNIQDDFKRISQLDRLGINGSQVRPDIIINDDYLADIFSPLTKVSHHPDRVELMANGVLQKTEAKNFRRTAGKLKFGKRQTNRVIIYINSYEGDIKRIAKALKHKLESFDPQYLQETFIITEKNGEPVLTPVYP